MPGESETQIPLHVPSPEPASEKSRKPGEADTTQPTRREISLVDDENDPKGNNTIEIDI